MFHPSSRLFILKLVFLMFAMVLLALSLLGWANAAFYGKGLEVTYPGYVTIQGQSFTELEFESALGAILTVLVLFIDVLQEAKVLEESES